MKYAISTLLLIFTSIPIAFADSERKVSRKMGETPDDIPCTCVFNKNRMWNPEKIVWNNEEWHCSKYNDDGTCESVALLNSKQTEIDPCSNNTSPLYCVFNLNQAPKFIEIEGYTWKCAIYDNNGKCIEAKKLKDD
ncbi:hypothetical protein [Vibrio sp. VPAP30]|uniref:hypothetical protein n=1 Tax=Vibrio sp. VPAP30 TaxID=1647102 RepID=UPI000659B0F3|nr:hypothetical protein [Vibrio sp. VPAP30]KLN66439.1 hypothetical protein ZX61_01915 [Vibrio sp. VPAP30]